MNAATRSKLEQLKQDPLLGNLSGQYHSGPATTSAAQHLATITAKTVAGPCDKTNQAPVPTPIPTQNASSLLDSARNGPRIISGSQAFDSLIISSDTDKIGGGLKTGQFLELSGCPGEGKTRVCISYALQACMSAVANGEDGPAALVIDTQGSICFNSLLEAALNVSGDDMDKAITLLDKLILWESFEVDDLFVALHSMRDFIQDNQSIKLIIIDSLSSPLNACFVPALSAEIVADTNAAQSKQRNGGAGGSNKKRRKSYFNNDAKQSAAFDIIRTTMNGLLRDIILAVTARGVAFIVTTQSKTKLTDDFGESINNVREAKHSFAVPQFFNFWHPPQAIQIILSAGIDGSRIATLTVTPSSQRGKHVTFQTTTGGIADL